MRILLASVLLLLAACNAKNPYYCEGVEDNNCKNAPKPCDNSGPDCLCVNGFCVECTTADTSRCSATEPVCGNDNSCRGCRADDECESKACLDTGACADARNVIYAAPNGVDAMGCGLAVGQNECTITRALVEVAGQRNIVRLAPGSYSVTTPDGLDFTKSATLIARSSVTITRGTGAGPIITVRPSQTLTLIGGTLRGPNNADGILCNNGALRVHEAMVENMTESGIESNSCDLTVSRSTIRSNLQGGVNMIGLAKTAAITNNFVYRNGTDATLHGGMVLLLAAGSRVEFNTVVDNDADAGVMSAGGITCNGTYDLAYNLIYRNVGGLDGTYQVNGSCTSNESYKASAPPTTNDVGFENPTGANPSYRLTAGSPIGTIRDARQCRDEVDFEGDSRPQNNLCDFGADEYRSP